MTDNDSSTNGSAETTTTTIFEGVVQLRSALQTPPSTSEATSRPCLLRLHSDGRLLALECGAEEDEETILVEVHLDANALELVVDGASPRPSPKNSGQSCKSSGNPDDSGSFQEGKSSVENTSTDSDGLLPAPASSTASTLVIHLRRKDAATTTDVLAFSVNDSIARVDWVVHIGATLGGSATPTTPVTYTIPEVITTAPNDVCVDATSAVTSAAIALPRASNATIVPPVFGLSGIRPNSLPSTTCTTPTSVLSLTPTVRSTAMLRAKTMPSFWAPLNVIKGALGHGEDATHVTPLSDSSAVMLKCVHRMVHAFKLRKEQRAAIEIQRVYRGYRARKTYLFIRTRVIALQALARRRTAQHVVAQLRLDRVIAKSQPHRTRVFMEMYATEASYVQQLSFAVNVFLKPLRALVEKAGVTSAQIVCMFGNIEEIHACHTEFLASLQPASEGWTEATVVSEPFLTLAERLDIYIPYCNNFDEAKATLAKCKKIAAFTSFLEHSEGVKKLQRLDLSSFLIQPIQRIPRYELLLKDLIKHTWPSHPDYADLQLALAKIKEAAKLLNRAKSYNESREEILNLKQKLQSHAGGAGTKNAQHRQSMHAGAATVSAMSLAQAAGTDDNLKLNYISEGFIGYRDVTGSVDALCDSELDVDVSVQNLTLKPAVEGKHGSGTPATQPLYAYLFIDMLILMRKSKATDNHSGTLSKVLALSRNNSKGSKSTVMSSIALDRAVVDPCEGERRNGALTGRFLLRTSDGRTHEFTADGTLSKARWLCDLDEALGQRLSHASSMAVASASTLPSSMEGQGSCDGYLAIHAQSEEQMVTPAACTPTGSPDKRKSYGTLSSLRSLTGNKTRMSQSTDGLDTMCKSSGTTLEHSPSKLKRLLARKKSK